MENLFFQTSLIAAFIAGVVALFAPCCITFLLPAYLGSVFKEKEKVILMTFIFGLGIFIALFPAVLGVALISRLLFRFHDQIYTLGGLVMLAVAVTTFLGLKMPMLNFSAKSSNKTDALSIFTLGIFSGITSACCAPVLIGVMTLTLLSPTFFGSLLVGGMYVFGMVIPLLLMGFFLSDKVSKLVILKKPIGEISLLGKTYLLTVSNIIASTVFLVTGFLVLWLNSSGRLSASNMDQFTKIITNTLNSVSLIVGNNFLVNIAFLAVVIAVIYWISRRV